MAPGDSTFSSVLRELAAAPSSTPPALLVGQRLHGRFVLEELIGRGGMGVVFRAHDEKLARKVALKLLSHPADLGAPERTRLLDEARALAQLAHPNIATVFDVDIDDGVPWLAMELLEGRSLRGRMREGALETHAVLRVARDVARGLAHAHAAGVVHRDLKPENVAVAEDGHAKLLDFGLARLLAPGGLSPDDDTGSVSGTPRYMSPEQAAGKAADARSDVYSFGLVLRELLSTPAARSDRRRASALDEVARACVADEPAARPPDGAALLALLEASGAAAPGRRRAVVASAVGAGVLVLTSLWPRDGEPAASFGTPTLSQLTESTGPESFPALSPDGKLVAYEALGVGDATDIFLLPLDGGTPRNLTASLEEDSYPTFSPDGQRIAYAAADEIWTMDLNGQARRRVVEHGYFSSFTPDGTSLLYSTSGYTSADARPVVSEVWTVDLRTGAKRRLLAADAIEPRVSPDGKWVLYWGLDEASNRDVWLTDIEAREAPLRVTDDPAIDYRAFFSDDGETILFLSDRTGVMTLWGIPFAEVKRGARAAPRALLGGAAPVRDLALLGRDGVFVERSFHTTIYRYPLERGTFRLGPPERIKEASRSIHELDVTKDGAHVLLGRRDPDKPALLDVASGVERSLTGGEGRDRAPRFLSSGEAVVFMSNRRGQQDFWRIDVEGGEPTRLTELGLPQLVYPTPTRDGRSLFAGDGGDVLRVDLDGPLPARVATTLAKESCPRGSALPKDVSPDDRLLSVICLDGPSGKVKLLILDAATGGVRATSDSFGGDFADERHVLRYDHEGRVLLWRFDDDVTTVLLEAERGLSRRARVAGDWLYVRGARFESDLWRLRLSGRDGAGSP